MSASLGVVDEKASYRRTADGAAFCVSATSESDLHMSALVSVLQFCHAGATLNQLREKIATWQTYLLDLLPVSSALRKPQLEKELECTQHQSLHLLTLVQSALAKGYLVQLS